MQYTRPIKIADTVNTSKGKNLLVFPLNNQNKMLYKSVDSSYYVVSSPIPLKILSYFRLCQKMTNL